MANRPPLHLDHLRRPFIELVNCVCFSANVLFLMLPLPLLWRLSASPTDGAAVYVHGEGANPRIRKCVIHHSNCVGVFVEDHAGVSLTFCTGTIALLLYTVYTLLY